MVKLASARESRMYGPQLARNRSEYMNAGLYIFATILLVSGIAAQLSKDPKSGLVLILISLGIMVIVNVHDLMAHLAGIDYRIPLMEHDLQLVLVEFAVPLVQSIGMILYFLAILFLFIQEEKGYGYFKLERHALNMLIAGPALWVLGSIHNSCQIYERADGHVQVLQESVHIPFLMGEPALLDRYVWGPYVLHWGLTNVVKVFKMQQVDGLRLEKLRGGAQERLAHEREGQVPLILEDQRRRKRQAEEVESTVGPTPYKDVLIGQA